MSVEALVWVLVPGLGFQHPARHEGAQDNHRRVNDVAGTVLPFSRGRTNVTMPAADSRVAITISPRHSLTRSTVSIVLMSIADVSTASSIENSRGS